jgi:Ca2+-binding EF-hand superfamily protein
MKAATASCLRAELASNMARVLDVFRRLDSDGSGEVDRREFHHGIRTTLTGEFTKAEVDDVFNAIDESGDGKISYRELQRTLRVPPSSSKPLPPRSLRLPPGQAAPSARAFADPSTEGGGTGGAVLHPSRKKHVFALYRDFKVQHADGVCKVGSFETLLRLTFPCEDRAHILAMAALIARHEVASALAAETAAQQMVEINALFDALDVDRQGYISLDEFLQVRHAEGGAELDASELTAIFHEKDADGSGALDREEFQSLVEVRCRMNSRTAAAHPRVGAWYLPRCAFLSPAHLSSACFTLVVSQACPLFLQLKDSIIARGRAKAEQKGKAELERQELWTIGMPKRRPDPAQAATKAPVATAMERPSLAKLSRTIMNARAAFRNQS